MFNITAGGGGGSKPACRLGSCLTPVVRPPPLPHILCINGSLRGTLGNSAQLIGHIQRAAGLRATVEQLVLAQMHDDMASIEQRLRRADAIVMCSGVYWNSHGSRMQRFIEVASQWELTDVFVGKPTGVVLSMDSVGGMEVAARLCSIMNLLGCVLPPLSSVVLSRVAQAAAAAADDPDAMADVYSPVDLQPMVDNLLIYLSLPPQPWRRWAVQPTQPQLGPYPGSGPLHIDHPPWAGPIFGG